MSNQMEYKCPACGGALAFDSASQKLKCPFCDSVYNLDQFEQQQPDPAQQGNLAGSILCAVENRHAGRPGGMRLHVQLG